MRKKFTMLLAALLACVGTAWAQTRITSLADVQENTSYVLYGKRAGVVTKQDGTGITAVKPDAGYDKSADVSQFAFIKHSDKYFLWSVSASKFLAMDGSLQATSQPDAIEFVAASGDYAGYVRMRFADNTGKNINVNNAGNAVVIDGWNFEDDGSTYYVEVSKESVDLSAAIALLNSSVEVTYVYKYDGVEVARKTKMQDNNSVYSAPDLGYYFTFTYPDNNTVSATNKEIEVICTANFPFTVSTDYANATWYVLQIRSNNKKYVVRGESAPYENTTTTPTTEDALWAFVGNPIDGIQVLNKAAGEGYTLGLDENNGVMTEATTTWNITKGVNGFLLRDGNEGNKYFHDYGSKLQIWDNASAAGDPGSAFVVTSEADMKTLATTALNNAKAQVAVYDEADYYTYSQEAVTAAKTALDAIATPADMLTALTAKNGVESAMATLTATTKGAAAPAVGDYIRLKNKQHGGFLKANDANLTNSADTDLSTLWLVEEGSEGAVKLKSVGNNKYIGEIRMSAEVAMVESANAKEFAWTNQTEAYAVFKETTGGDYAYGHISGGKLVGWLASADATQWIVSKVESTGFREALESTLNYTKIAVAEGAGYYTLADATALTEAQSNAQSLLDGESNDIAVLIAATEALTEALEAGTINLPNGTYQLISADQRFGAKKMAIYNNGTELKWKELDENDKAFYWEITPGQNGTYSFKSLLDNKYVNGDVMSAEKTDVQLNWLTVGEFNILSNQVTLHAQGHDSGKGTSGDILSFAGGANSPSSWKLVKAEASFFYEVVYEYQYNGKTVATQTASVKEGGEYPDFTYAGPYGVIVADAKPEGQVTNGETLQIALEIEKELPFDAVAEGTPTTWYYAQMHAFPGYGFYISANEGNLVWHGADDENAHKIADNANVDNYLWGFVGNLWEGYKMVNKAGKAVCSTGSGEVSVGELAEATTLIAWNSQANGEWFCLKSSNNYLNLNTANTVINHWSANDNGSSIFLTEFNKTYSLEVTAAGYATYYSQYRLAIPETVKAYVVSEVEGAYAVLEQVTGVLPAYTGVIVEGEEGTYEFVTSAAAPATIASNKLQGTIVNTEVSDNAYILADGVDGVGLYKVELTDGKFTNNANKAYLPASAIASANAPMLSFNRGEGTTSIDELSTVNGQQTTVIYDLTGRRVEKMEKGIYIVNGRKVVIK